MNDKEKVVHRLLDDVIDVEKELYGGWINKHSINCIKCGNLVDERDCIHAIGGEGEICPKC